MSGGPSKEVGPQPPLSVIDDINANLEGVGENSLFSSGNERAYYWGCLAIILGKDLEPDQILDPDVRGDIIDIAVHGRLRDTEIIPPANVVLVGVTDNPYNLPRFPEAVSKRDHRYYRLALLGAYLRNPHVAEGIIAGNVIGLHGSSSGSLLSILDNGLMPLASLREAGLRVATGAKDNLGEDAFNKVRFVPFGWVTGSEVRAYWGDKEPVTDEKLDEAIGRVAAQMRGVAVMRADTEFARFHKKHQPAALGAELLELQRIRNFLVSPPHGEEERLEQALIVQNFPVVYGVSKEGIDPDKVQPVSSTVEGEFGVVDGVQAKHIKTIFVPRQKQGIAQRLVDDKGLTMEVCAIEDVPIFDKPFGKAEEF